MLEAMRYLNEALGQNVFLVACLYQYPFSLACALMGIENVMRRLIDDRPMLDALMERCVEYAAAYALALADAGADMLSGGDSPAGLIGPRSYRELALPFERQLIARLKSQCSQPVSLHICGKATPILADMAASGADVLELDHHVEMATACQTLGPTVGIWGNLDPVALLAQGTPEQVRQATASLMRTADAHGHQRYVVSSGCTLAPDTAAANLHAMLDAVRISGHTGI
jgi:uroporphyrinogen decarboxylase